MRIDNKGRMLLQNGKKKNAPLQSRKLFIILFLLPIVGVSVLYYLFSVHALDIEVQNITLRSISYANKNIKARLNTVSEISQSILSASFPYLNREIELDTLSKQIDDISSLNGIISSYENRNMIHKIQLFVDDHKLYANQMDRFFPISSLSQQDLAAYRQSFDLGKNVIWKGPETALFSDGLGGKEYNRVIQCLSLLKYTGNYDQFSGILCISILEDELFSLLDTGLNYNEIVFLVNQDGVVISHPDKGQIGERVFSPEEIAFFAAEQTGVYNSRSDLGSEMVAFAHISFPSWTLLVRIPKKTIHERSLHFFYTGGFVSFVIFVLIMVVAAYSLYKTMLRDNIQRFNYIVYRLAHETYGLLEPDRQKNEQADLAALENHVEKLVEVFRTTMEREYQSQIFQRDAQLHALQAQINPHFLYNTLDLIKWKILDSEKETGIGLINALSRYFRMSLNKGRDIVELKDEIELIKAYLDIQLQRFDGRFQAEFDLDPALNNVQIPKMTLQPFVENALLHGLHDRVDNHGLIQITATRPEPASQDILITISDNGCGMDQAKIQAALHSSGSSGYGIYNVNQRLRLFYGEDYGVEILSEIGCGTQVHIRIRDV